MTSPNASSDTTVRECWTAIQSGWSSDGAPPRPRAQMRPGRARLSARPSDLWTLTLATQAGKSRNKAAGCAEQHPCFLPQRPRYNWQMRLRSTLHTTHSLHTAHYAPPPLFALRTARALHCTLPRPLPKLYGSIARLTSATTRVPIACRREDLQVVVENAARQSELHLNHAALR